MKNSITLAVTRSQLWTSCFLCLVLFPCTHSLGSCPYKPTERYLYEPTETRPHEPITTTKNDPVIAQLVANPFVGNCCLSVDAPGNTTLFIRMVNNIGAEVLYTKVLVQKGNNYITLPASQLSNGFYTLQLRGKNGKLISVLKGEKR